MTDQLISFGISISRVLPLSISFSVKVRKRLALVLLLFLLFIFVVGIKNSNGSQNWGVRVPGVGGRIYLLVVRIECAAAAREPDI